MPLTTDWNHLQAAITEWADAPGEGDRTVVVLSLPITGSTAKASTAVAASLLRGLVNDYFETYEVKIHAEYAHITNTGITQGPAGYSLAIFLHAEVASGFVEFAAEIRTAVEQALEDLPKYLERPDVDTTKIMEALKQAERLEDTDD